MEVELVDTLAWSAPAYYCAETDTLVVLRAWWAGQSATRQRRILAHEGGHAATFQVALLHQLTNREHISRLEARAERSCLKAQITDAQVIEAVVSGASLWELAEAWGASAADVRARLRVWRAEGVW